METMRKLLTILLLLVVLTSCDQSIKKNLIDESGTVPLSYHDSTRWADAKILIEPENILYIKSEKDVYKIKEFPAGVYIFCAVFLFFWGLFMGYSIAKD
jgi:hypothetical protein